MIASVLLVGCAMRNTPHYEPMDASLVLRADEQSFVQVLPAAVSADLRVGRIAALLARPPTGEAALALVTEDQLRTIPTEVLYAIFAVQLARFRGGELDMLVDAGGGDGPIPVTVWMEPDRTVEVAWGTAPPAPSPRPDELADLDAWTQDLIHTYGLSGIGSVDRDWTEDEIGDVAVALSLLGTSEALAVRGIDLMRRGDSPRSATRELAFFDPRTDPARLEFYDLAFVADQAFVGPVHQPVRAGVMTILHEIAHAVADLPVRQAYQAYAERHEIYLRTGNPDDRAATREAWRAYRDLGGSGPVIDAWRAFRDGRGGPSAYGFRNPHESFAEAFALAHLDPEALERALPGATAWFDAGEHLPRP